MKLTLFYQALVCSIAFLGFTQVSGALAISNGHLNVDYDQTDSSLTLQSKKLKESKARITFPLKVAKAAAKEVKDPVWGQGQELDLSHDDGSQTTLRIYPDLPFLLIHTKRSNSSEKATTHRSMDIFDLKADLNGQPLMSFGSGGLKKPSDQEGSYSFHAFVNGKSRNGLVCGSLTHRQGVGVFHPDKDGTLKARIDFGHFEIAGKSARDTDTIVLGFFEDARLGLESYAEAVAREEKIKLPPMPNVYCTWYHSRASNEEMLKKNTEFAASKLAPFGLGVMQIDDQWQSLLPKGVEQKGEIKKTGPIKVFADTNENYPSGMAHTAKMISSHGMVPGIWFMPFAGNFRNPYFDHDVFAKAADGIPYHDQRWSGTCVDSTHPKGEKFIYERTKRIYDWGYRYFKIDGLHTGMPSKNIYVNAAYKEQNFGDSVLHDSQSTHIQAYRKGLRTLRKAAPNVFVLGCNVSQNMMSMGPAIGLLDAMRIGPDNGKAGAGRWDHVTLGAWHGTNLYFFNKRVWYNDPDPVYVREQNPLEKARWMCSWLAVAGGMHSSSEQYEELPDERLDVLRRCLPSHSLNARPVDLLETNQPRIWLVKNERLNVVGLFNWDEKQASKIKYDLGKLGLKTGTRYVGFDFWKNEFVTPFSDALDQTLPGATCRVLALRPVSDHPQLVSTSRHVTQGLMDVTEETWDEEMMTLSGKSEVVGNDLYELRIALPEKGKWTPKNVMVDFGEAKIVKQTPTSIRVEIQTDESKEVSWKLRF